MASTKYQPVTLRPLTGLLDLRSSVDETPPGAWRWKSNLSISPDGALSRAMGWLRFGTGLCPGNLDFHNQGLPVESREPFTFSFASTANDGRRRLFVGTKTRLFYANEIARSWVEIASGLGNDGSQSLTQTRFNAGQLQNQIVFTNGLDAPRIHTLGTGVVATIPSLANSGEGGGAISVAQRAVSWSGVMFLMNLVEDGEIRTNRIRWSDLNDPTWWNVTNNPNTGAASISDYQDLDAGEVILNSMPLGSALYVFTNQSIWRCSFTTDATSATLNCVKVYTEPRNRARCLAYPNSLVSTGNAFFYLGNDAIYSYDPYMSEPERVEWIHRATTLIFQNPETLIDRRACNSPVAEYVPGVNEDGSAGGGEIFFSWPTYNPFASADPDGEINCDDPPVPPVVGNGVNGHTLVVNLRYRTCDYRDYGATTMVNFTSDIELSGECDQQPQFINAIGSDFTLKKLNSAYSREMYNPTTEEYSTIGYYSVGRMLFPFERYDSDKSIKSLLLEVEAINPIDPAVIRMRIGTSFEALDPNVISGLCGVLWHRMSDQQIKCRATRTPAQYVADNVRPYDPVNWHFIMKGRLLYLEFTLANPGGTACIGGGCTLSRMEVEVKLA